MIVLKTEIIERMIAHALEDAPMEACGYIAGTGDRGEEVIPMTNADKSPYHYSFSPEEQFKVMKDARKKNLDLIAAYHSHPETPARPSVEDLRLANDPNIVYVIVSMMAGVEPIRAFKIRQEREVEVPLEIIT